MKRKSLFEDAEQLERRERERSGSLNDPDSVFDDDGQQRFSFEHYPPIAVNGGNDDESTS